MITAKSVNIQNLWIHYNFCSLFLKVHQSSILFAHKTTHAYCMKFYLSTKQNKLLASYDTIFNGNPYCSLFRFTVYIIMHTMNNL